jgi:sulfatase modifying factor 1
MGIKMLPRFLSNATLLMMALTAIQCQRTKQDPEKLSAAEIMKQRDQAVFIHIPAGEFTMGDAFDGKKGPLPHKVNVSSFHIQSKEVSKAQWDDVRAWGLKNGYTDLPEGQSKAATHPVQKVTWCGAVKWCNTYSEKEGLTPCYYTDAAQTVVYRTSDKDLSNTMVNWNANGYRLPTEAEWEKAARGGLSGKRFPWGDTISHNEANFNNKGNEDYQNESTNFHPTYDDGEQPYTSPVGSFAANGYGLYDMTGNVSEWCWDGYGDYPAALVTDPRGAADACWRRALRGGSWDDRASCCGVADRFSGYPFTVGIGLRPVHR